MCLVIFVFWSEFDLHSGASKPGGTRKKINTHSCGQYVVSFFEIFLSVTHTDSRSCFSPSCHPLFSFAEALLLSVSLVRQQDSPLWLAVCDCTGEGVGGDLVWVLPENAKGQTSLHSEYEGFVTKAKLTYQFPLALHEGEDLTCVYRFGRGFTEKKTIHVPRYREFRNNTHASACTLLLQM